MPRRANAGANEMRPEDSGDAVSIHAPDRRDAMKTSPKLLTSQAPAELRAARAAREAAALLSSDGPLAATRIRAARGAAIDLLAAICDLMAERGITWPSRTRITIRRTPYRPGVEIQT